MKNMNRRFFLTAVLFLAVSGLWGLSVPELRAHVNDNAGLMNARDRQEAEDYLTSLQESTGIQICVLTIKSLEGESLEGYSMKVCEKWQLGKKGEDNGALLLVAYADRSVRIEVGYGLEGLLTDTKSGLIIRNVIIPEFKTGDYSEGILKGVKTMGGVASDNAELVEKSVRDEIDEDDSAMGTVVMIIWFIIFFMAMSNRSGLLGLLLWSMTGRRGPRPKRPSSGSSNHVHYHSGGYHGGGGFSGGGGGFGGGGASGHW